MAQTTLMNPRLLTSLALGFSALLALQALLGGWLFITNIGITPQSISAYYAEKSLHGTLEVLVPHTLYIAIALMAALHFLAFIDTIDHVSKTRFSNLIFALFLLDQFSVLPIMIGLPIFSILKLIAFIGFEILLVILVLWMFQQTLKEIK